MHESEPSEPGRIDPYWLDYVYGLRRLLHVLFYDLWHRDSERVHRRTKKLVIAYLRPFEAVLRSVILIRAAAIAATLPEPEPQPQAEPEPTQTRTQAEPQSAPPQTDLPTEAGPAPQPEPEPQSEPEPPPAADPERKSAFRVTWSKRKPPEGAISAFHHASPYAPTAPLLRRIAALDAAVDDIGGLAARYAVRLRAMMARAEVPIFDYIPARHREHEYYFGEVTLSLTGRIAERLLALKRKLAPDTG